MEIFTENLGQWLFVGLILVAMLYTAFVIKDEKLSYQENSKVFLFHNFSFPIPSWWATKKTSSNEVVFHRSDTKYEWKASFQVFKLNNNIPHSKDLILNILEDKGIQLDELNKEVHSKDQLKFKNNILKNNDVDITRVEGTASDKNFERLYYDCFVIINRKKREYLLCESVSSVLNGLVEGPYFEESILHLEMKD